MTPLRIDLVEGGRIALGSLVGNRLRTLLTTLGIGVGVATLLAILGIIQGLDRSFADQLASLGSSSLYVSKFPWVITDDWWKYRNRKDFDPSLVDALREQATLATAVAPSFARHGSVSLLGQSLSRVRIVGTTADYPAVAGVELTAGRFLSDADSENRKAVVVIGADVAEGLFPQADPLGTTIRIRGVPFLVVGTLARQGALFGQSQDLLAIIPFKTFAAVLGRRHGFSIGVAVADQRGLDAAEDQLLGIVRRARATPPDAPDDFEINRPEQLAATYQQLTAALYGVAIGVGLITLLVGGFGIMNIMLVSVRERTREIGLRRALGARRRTVVVQFLLEAVVVSVVGGTVGTLTGLGSASLIALLSPLAAAVEPATVVFGVCFAAFVGLVFGIWPAARAASLDPVEALRHE
ncbi:MAG: ABC transporter permease [Myxococcota bacterium]|jgi:putative ABC transport system permease protein|nr:ABC transporter permease [Myxococcota bacterium]